MKCPNCGFETESAFCQMCGTKIPDTAQEQKNEPIVTEYTSPLPQTGFEQVEGFTTPQVNNEMPDSEANQPPLPYIPQAEQPIDKKKMLKIVKIVAACVIGAVIVAGIAINIAAAVSGNSNSIFGDHSVSDFVNSPEMYYGDY